MRSKKLIYGIIFGIGFVIALAVSGLIQETFTEKNKGGSAQRIWENPEGFEFIEHNILKNKEIVTISGKVKNNTESNFSQLELIAYIFNNSEMLDVCKGKSEKINTKEAVFFAIECPSIPTSELPQTAKYKLAVSAGREPIID